MFKIYFLLFWSTWRFPFLNPTTQIQPVCNKKVENRDKNKNYVNENEHVIYFNMRSE